MERKIKISSCSDCHDICKDGNRGVGYKIPGNCPLPAYDCKNEAANEIATACFLPPSGSCYFNKEAIEVAFNEWAKREHANPDKFNDCKVGNDGNLDSGYGKRCVNYIEKLIKELYVIQC